MKKILKELHHDIERYLEEDCYCPNEVYSIDGFGYMLVYADNEYELLGKYKFEGRDVYLVATTAEVNEVTPILLTIWISDDDHVDGMERYALTEHNIKEIKAVLSGEKDKYKLKLSEHDALLKQTQKILALADIVSVSH